MLRLRQSWSFLLAAAYATGLGSQKDWSFLLAYKDQTANKAVWDPRFKKFLAEELPRFEADFGFERKKGGKTPLKDASLEVIGGPPDTLGFNEGTCSDAL